MRDLILGDLHIGIKNSNNHFREFIRQYLEYVIDYCLQNGISRIIQVGDLFHSRHSLVHKDHDMIRDIFEEIENSDGLIWIQLIGNHDATYKHTLDSNTPQKVSEKFSSIKIIDHPTFDKDYTYLPWICDDNREDCVSIIAERNTDIVLGHLELDGWEQTKGHVIKSNMKDEIFHLYDHVYTGHYHVRSERNNITYVGVPYPLTKNDIDSSHGFTVIDRETKKAEFIENDKKWSLFQIYDYHGEAPEKMDVEHLRNRIVFFNLHQRATPAKLKKIKSIVDQVCPIDVKYIVEYEEEKVETSIDESVLKTNTKGAIHDYITSQEGIAEDVQSDVILFLNNIVDEIEGVK